MLIFNKNSVKMAYTPIPVESKTSINKAGVLLTQDAAGERAYLYSLELANRWRACHAYPINTFQATLRTKLSGYKGNPIVAQRLKRMPTVIDKLKRHPNMKLTTMQDIAGVRGIVEDIEDVYRIVGAYVDNKNFPHELVEKYDYINFPRNEDGYRSVHVVYKYVNKSNPSFDGLRVEIQIRTKLQHIWATAVETMGTFIGQALKTRQGDKEWLDFFALVSAGFSHMEHTAPIPRFEHLDEKQVNKEIAIQEQKLGVLDKVKNFSYVVNIIGDSKGHTYHLVMIDYNLGTISVISYNRDSYQQALNDYDTQEAQMNDKMDIVLVSAGKIDTLKKAYPNLFLDLSEFESILKKIVHNNPVIVAI
jgi:putative GTP pyrophosphokinase